MQPEPYFQVIGEAGNADQAFEPAEKLSPDVIIMDINLGEMDGVSVTRRILSKHPHIKIIGLSMHDEKSIIDALYQAEAVAYLTKSAPSEEIIALSGAAYHKKQQGNPSQAVYKKFSRGMEFCLFQC